MLHLIKQLCGNLEAHYQKHETNWHCCGRLRRYFLKNLWKSEEVSLGQSSKSRIPLLPNQKCHTLLPKYPSWQNKTNYNRIKFGEVTDVLGKVSTRKSSDPDHIITKIIHHLPSLHIILQDLLKICVFHGYQPRAWERAWALMIHKPSKRRSDSSSYRHISLLCCLRKVFEAMMTKRVMSWAENIDQLLTEQSGFRKHHSSNDKLLELTQAVCLGAWAPYF